MTKWFREDDANTYAEEANDDDDESDEIENAVSVDSGDKNDKRDDVGAKEAVSIVTSTTARKILRVKAESVDTARDNDDSKPPSPQKSAVKRPVMAAVETVKTTSKPKTNAFATMMASANKKAKTSNNS
jgi:hypothetical protein